MAYKITLRAPTVDGVDPRSIPLARARWCAADAVDARIDVEAICSARAAGWEAAAEAAQDRGVEAARAAGDAEVDSVSWYADLPELIARTRAHALAALAQAESGNAAILRARAMESAESAASARVAAAEALNAVEAASILRRRAQIVAAREAVHAADAAEELAAHDLAEAKNANETVRRAHARADAARELADNI
jgi:hypothetical protein